MKLKNLRVNNIEHPLGFQIMPLSFSWTVEEAREAKEQQSARIRIYENVETEADMEGKKAVYDSGEVTDADSLDYSVNVELKPRTRYQWSVEVTADTKEQVSAESWFETGKTDEAWENHLSMTEQPNRQGCICVGSAFMNAISTGKKQEMNILRRGIIPMTFIYRHRPMMCLLF